MLRTRVGGAPYGHRPRRIKGVLPAIPKRIGPKTNHRIILYWLGWGICEGPPQGRPLQSI